MSKKIKEIKLSEVTAKPAKVRKYKKVLAGGKVFVPSEGMVVDQVVVSGGNATIT